MALGPYVGDLCPHRGISHSTRLTATAAFAAEVLGRPEADRMYCPAILYGLRGETSLRPWIEEGVGDVEELARRDYEPEHGAGWHQEWQRQLAETETILDGRIGPTGATSSRRGSRPRKLPRMGIFGSSSLLRIRKLCR